MEPKCNHDNTGIIIVTYNPTSLELLLESCIGFARYIIVVDNNSTNNNYVKATCGKYNITTILLTNNTGIATAINIGSNELFKRNISWIITFDQDSVPPNNLINYYNEIISKEDNIGLIGVGYDYNIHILPKESEVKYKKSLDQITSGLLHNVQMWKSIGGYEDQYFIDCVDFEYSLRASYNGYNTYTIQNEIMTHSLGSPKCVKLLGIPIVSMNHNAFRQYYIVRNHFWLARKYWKRYPIFILIKFYHLFIRVCKTLMIDDNKKEKLNRIIKGIKDGLK